MVRSLGIILITLATMLVFVLIGITKHKENADDRTFFLMGREGSTSDYTATTVAYNLQIAVTVYFIYWGYTFGWSNIIFIITWLLGFLAYSYYAPQLSEALVNNDTLFQYLAGNNKFLRVLSVALFSTSLVGIVYTELYFSSEFFSDLFLGSYDSNAEQVTIDKATAYWLSFIFLTIFTLIYASIGGMHKVVVTDKIQLAVSYVSIGVFFSFLSPMIAAQGSAVHSSIYIPALCLFLAIALVPGLISFFGTKKNAGNPLTSAFSIAFPQEQANAPILGAYFSAIMIGVALINAPITAGPIEQPVIPGLTAMINEPFGIWPIIGFSIMNIIWQFSDYTAFHRLSLLRLEREESSRTRRVRVSIRATMVSSPLTWSIGILVGMAIKSSGLAEVDDADVFGSFTSLMIGSATAGSTMFVAALLALSLFMVSVLMSTVDSAMISIGQMIILDGINKRISVSLRYIILASMGLILIAIGFTHAYLNLNVFTLLNAIYSWGLIFAPIVFLKLLKGDINGNGAVAALCAGALVGAISSTNPLDLPFLVELVFPTLAAIATTIVVLFAFEVLPHPIDRKPQEK